MTATTEEGIRAYNDAHRYADTDNEPSSIHHTLGRGPNQAAKGNHGHTFSSPDASPPVGPALGDEWIVTDKGNLRRRWDGPDLGWVDQTIGGDALSATAIDGKTITGALIRTAASGQRVELKGEQLEQISFYSGRIEETLPGRVAIWHTTNGGGAPYNILEVDSGKYPGGSGAEAAKIYLRSTAYNDASQPSEVQVFAQKVYLRRGVNGTVDLTVHGSIDMIDDALFPRTYKFEGQDIRPRIGSFNGTVDSNGRIQIVHNLGVVPRFVSGTLTTAGQLYRIAGIVNNGVNSFEFSFRHGDTNAVAALGTAVAGFWVLYL